MIANPKTTKTTIQKILAMLLITFQPYALSGWREVTTDQVATEFVNVDTVERSAAFAKMWNMSDYKIPQEVGNGRLFKSSKTLQEYDCTHQKKRLISMIHYVENMGLGQVAFFDTTLGTWREVKEGSIGEMHFNYACKKVSAAE